MSAWVSWAFYAVWVIGAVALTHLTYHATVGVQ